MTKIIKLTESDLTKIVKTVISEQLIEREITQKIQAFLNKRMNAGLELDGKTGPNSKTEKAIAKYQMSIGETPADGVWGPNTYSKMPEKDKIMLKNIVVDQGGVWDNFVKWINKNF
jgi:peptidoglycan hydrolase-like protein with peptidoglycan-binding domain